SLVVALAASLTLAPALLCILGPLAFWPGRVPSAPADPGTAPRDKRGEGFWGPVSRLVIDRPALVWGVAVAVLLPLALVGLGVRANSRATGELSPSSNSVRGLEVIQRHFTAGEVGPITVLLEGTRDWESPEGQAVVGHLSQGLTFLDNVAEVRSL